MPLLIVGPIVVGEKPGYSAPLLWVEIREPELDVTVVIPAEPERALEAFYHPYAYAAAHSALPQSAEPLRRS